MSDVLMQWERDEPLYREYGEALDADIRTELRTARVPVERVSVRLKDTDSLAKKVLRKGYESYSEVTDKVGVRVVVRVPSDVDRAVSALHARLGGVIDDKRTALDVDTFAYRSVHIQISGLGSDARFQELQCELQVRTVSEDAWATMSHFLNYKTVNETPYLLRRSLAALAALLELADMRFEELSRELTRTSGYTSLYILSEIEGTFLSLGGDVFDRVLSQDVIETLEPAFHGRDAKAISDEIIAWAESNRSWLADRLQRRRDDGVTSVFLGQPEVLMIGKLLSSRSSALAPLWSDAFDVDELERVAQDLSFAVPGLQN